MLHRLHSVARRRARAGRAERDRRYRARVRACKAVALVEYDGEVLDMLIRLHWLDELQESDARAVGRAISALLAASARV